MEIYVKDKELPKKTCENCPLCEHFEKDAHGKGKHEVACLYEGTFNNILFGDKLCPENCNIIKSLEQHDAEIKKPLEDEIERLCRLCDKLNNDYFKQKEISDYGMKELNITIRQLKQERQEVISELEEWVDKASNNYISKFDINGQDALFLVKQKLNEMKGEK